MSFVGVSKAQTNNTIVGFKTMEKLLELFEFKLLVKLLSEHQGVLVEIHEVEIATIAIRGENNSANLIVVCP